MHISNIVRTLADDNCNISHLSSRCFLRRFQERQLSENAPMPNGPVKDVTPQLMTFIDNQMEQNGKLTAPNLWKNIYEEFEDNFPKAKLKSFGKNLAGCRLAQNTVSL